MSEVILAVSQQKEVVINHEDAIKYVIEFLRCPRQNDFSNYGYDLYLHVILIVYCKEKFSLENNDSLQQQKQLSHLFMDACSDLCRRGILRPDVYDISGGAGYIVLHLLVVNG